MQTETGEAARSVIDAAGLQRLIDRLASDGLEIIGPRLGDGAIGLGRIEGVGDLPAGWRDEQEAGRYRCVSQPGGALFAHGAPMHAWKRWLYPPEERLSRMRRVDGGFVVGDEGEPAGAFAFFGMRACDLSAIRTLDRVLGGRRPADTRYVARREASIVVAVNCTRSAATCFCASMGTGPKVGQGYDLLLTELQADDGLVYTVAVGSERGARYLAEIGGGRAATAAERQAEAAGVEAARASQTRSMVADVPALLRRNLEHRQWSQVAERCLGCANCTMVCPTCFCATVEDTTDLSGQVAERWRKWDSCFTIDFSHIHGGSIRRSGAARYRQWMTHKLSSWWQQFGTSGCVGCGRCIAWCPVGIDITEEARSLRDSEGGSER